MFVVEGHDIDLYPDAESAAVQVESYNAMSLDYFGADGTVYKATVEGPQWGPVTLHRTQENRLNDVIRLLRTEAQYEPRHSTEACLCRPNAQTTPRRSGTCSWLAVGAVKSVGWRG